MKKEIFAICLLVLLLTGVLINNHILKNITENMILLIDETIVSAESGNWREAMEKAGSVKAYWDKKSAYTHIVIRHSKLDDATAAICAFMTEVYRQDTGGVAGAGNALAEEISGLYAMEKLKIGTIF